jgi:hypothetical protein
MGSAALRLTRNASRTPSAIIANPQNIRAIAAELVAEGLSALPTIPALTQLIF